MVKAKEGSTKHKQVAKPLAEYPRIQRKQTNRVERLHGPDIFQVQGVLTPEEAELFIEVAESSGFQHQSSRGPAYGEAYRDNYRLAFKDDQLAQHLWEATGLSEIFQDISVAATHAVGLNPTLRLYRYSAGQRFGRHVDESVEVQSTPVSGKTAYTLLIYLSGGPTATKGAKRAAAGTQLLGGETVFYGHRGKVVATVAPQAGLALLHRHGDHCLEHEGMEVKNGVKYVLRSDVVFH